MLCSAFVEAEASLCMQNGRAGQGCLSAHVMSWLQPETGPGVASLPPA